LDGRPGIRADKGVTMFGHRDGSEPEPLTLAGALAAPAWESMPLADIVHYLAEWGGVVDIDTGSPRVTYPPGTDEKVKAHILPHLIARRGEIIEHFFSRAAMIAKDDRRAGRGRRATINPETGETPAQERERVLAQMRAESVATGKTLWFLKRNGLAATDKHKPERKKLPAPSHRVIEVTIDREATYASVGSTGWVRLPKVTTRIEDQALMSAAERGRK
jgi:hypothetical protein